jgi:hypothetical protein
MKPVQQRFHLEFGAVAGEQYYRRGLTLLQARNAAGKVSPSSWSAGSFNVSKADDDLAELRSRPGALADEGEGIRVVPSRTARVGSREWAACLRSEFSRTEFIDFFSRELSYDEARAECDRVAATRPPPVPRMPS